MKKRIIVTATKEMPVDTITLSRTLNMPHEIEVVPLLFGDMSLTERERYWERIAYADALVVRTGVIPYELIGQCHSLKIISVHGEGVHQVEVKAATEAGIYITNVPDGNAQAAAEFTIALMLNALRHIHKSHQYMKQGMWDAARVVGAELCGKKIGLLGLGAIGQRVAKVVRALDAEALYWDVEDCNSDLAHYMSIDELFSTADVVSIHLALKPSTSGLIDRRLLSKLKSDAWLINTARGPIIKHEDLIQALEENWFAGAALDVFEQEPLPADSPLLALNNVILTPHLAGSSQQGLQRMSQVAGMDINAVLSGQRPKHALLCFGLEAVL